MDDRRPLADRRFVCLAWGGVLAAAACCWAGARAASAEQPTPDARPPARVTTVVEGYGKGQPFNVPSGIWFDVRHSEIYVADRGNHKIAVFATDGRLLRSFTHWVSRADSAGKVAVQPGEPLSVAVNSRGDIFVADGLDTAVDVLDYRGRSMGRISVADSAAEDEGSKPATPPTPVQVAVDGQDHVYVATSGGHCQILVFDEKLRLLRRLGRRGRERGALYAVTGLSVDRQGQILVTDAQSVPVQVFSPDGELRLAFGEHEVGWQNFSLPSGIARDGDGNLWVADPLRQVVKRFDSSGRFLGFIGGLGNAPGDTYYPIAVAGDGGRLILVLEKTGARFQVFQVTP